MVVGQSGSDEISSLRLEIKRLESQKHTMEANKLGSGFVERCINSEKLSLMGNMEKLERLQTGLKRLKVQLVESGSPGNQ